MVNYFFKVFLFNLWNSDIFSGLALSGHNISSGFIADLQTDPRIFRIFSVKKLIVGQVEITSQSIVTGKFVSLSIMANRA